MGRNRQSDLNETVRYLVQSKPSNFLIEIPAHWKVTFSNGPNPQSHMTGSGYCMRVYEGEKLRAVYANVQGFRDLSIPTAKEHRRETGASSWEKDSEGNFKESTEVKVDRTLILEATDESVFEIDEPDTPY